MVGHGHQGVLVVADTRLKVVTIMNYPPEPQFRQMCYAFLDTAIANGAESVTVLYEDRPPTIALEHRRKADIEVVPCRSHDVGHSHFNLRFKLANLASLDFPFLYLDADTLILDDLNYLWSRRHAKPWIGIDHQWIPNDRRTHRSPFLNSGVQLVSDPSFYDLAAILAVQNSVAPLHRAAEFTKDQMFACPGVDQAILFRYFREVNYDYLHPEIGSAWNSCAGVTEVTHDGMKWRGRTRGLAEDHDVHLLHYWSPFKPWNVHCPIYASYAGRE
ncbi:MAG: hypothetical protein C0467_22375 [Planctomycetaceae bacterium]|nr:hypothetical protein [Planctomycetaceae bacterium]